MALISIIVPVYNVAPYLVDCISSLLSQTLKDIEIIAINDCSTDNSLEILKTFAQSDERLKVVDNKSNIKTAAARNLGIENATGKYICFVDGDDFLDNKFCEELYNLAEETGADIAKGICQTIKDGKAVSKTDNQEIEAKGKFAFFGHLWTAIYNREKLVVKYQIRFSVDFFCFQIQAVYYANRIACTDKAIYNYVRHENSCDSEYFTLEKWQRLNLGHANYIRNWILRHEYPSEIKQLYQSYVEFLCYYGFYKLKPSDLIKGSTILTTTLKSYNKYKNLPSFAIMFIVCLKYLKVKQRNYLRSIKGLHVIKRFLRKFI